MNYTEMIGGNNGSTDKISNISMSQEVFNYVGPYAKQAKDALRPADIILDSSYVIIPCLPIGGKNYMLCGYNSRLESDSRGGDFCHYVAVESTGPFNSSVLQDIRLFCEEGYLDYIRVSDNNEEKKYPLPSTEKEVNKEALKAVVVKLFELYSDGYKPNAQLFLTHNSDTREFSAYSIKFYCELMKYLPHKIREKLTFLSSLGKPASTTRYAIVFCAQSCGKMVLSKCLNVEEEIQKGESKFAALADMIFSLSEEEREALFLRYDTDVEENKLPSDKAFNTQFYLFDFEHVNNWRKDPIAQVYEDVKSNKLHDQYIQFFPAYRDVIFNRIYSDSQKFQEYICRKIEAAENINDVFETYKSAVDFLAQFEVPLYYELYKSANKKYEFIFSKSSTLDDLTDVISAATEYSWPIDRVELTAKINKVLLDVANDSGILFETYCKIMRGPLKHSVIEESLYGTLTNSFKEEITKLERAGIDLIQIGNNMKDVFSSNSDVFGEEINALISSEIRLRLAERRLQMKLEEDKVAKLKTEEEAEIKKKKVNALFDDVVIKGFSDFDEAANFSNKVLENWIGVAKVHNADFNEKYKLCKDSIFNNVIECLASSLEKDMKNKSGGAFVPESTIIGLKKYFKTIVKLEENGIRDGIVKITEKGLYTKDGMYLFLCSIISILRSQDQKEFIDNIIKQYSFMYKNEMVYIANALSGFILYNKDSENYDGEEDNKKKEKEKDKDKDKDELFKSLFSSYKKNENLDREDIKDGLRKAFLKNKKEEEMQIEKYIMETLKQDSKKKAGIIFSVKNTFRSKK